MADRQRGAPDDVLGMEEAISLLEVAPDRVQLMIDGGLLKPVPGTGQLRGVGKPRLWASGGPDGWFRQEET